MISRRSLLKSAALAPVAALTPARATPTLLFDGKTLDGWIQSENSATSLSSANLIDPAAFAAKLANGSDPLTAFLREHLQPATRADLATFDPNTASAKAVISALVKDLNALISGPSIYDPSRFSPAALRPETQDLLHRRLTGYELARLNKLLLEDAFPNSVAKSATTGWVVKDGAMASTGAGRGVIYTARDFNRFRLTFTMRHVSGNPDHQACVLIFCTRPQPNEKPLDALAGIQFQVPNGGHWDYRPGMNNAGNPFFTSLTKTRFDAHQWSRVTITADASTGVARMTVAQPVDAEPIEMLAFNDPAAGKIGPVAWQMHNAGLFDEFKDAAIEIL